MSNLQSAFMIIMGELSIILAVILGYLAFRSLRKHKSIMSAIEHLTNKIRNCKDERAKMLQDFLTQTCHLSQESAETRAKALLEKEQLFYNVLMQTYVNNDHEALKDLDQTTEEVIGAYRNLVSESVKTIASEAELDLETRTQQLTSTIDELSEKNAHLDKELQQLKHEMDVTVQEYSSAFRNRPENNKADGDTDENDSQATTDESSIAIESQDIAENDGSPKQDSIAIEAATDEPSADANDVTMEPAPEPAAASGSAEQQLPDMQIDDDDSIEPDFETHGFDESPVNDDTADEAQSENLDDEIKADLEALTAQFDAEQEAEQEGETTIPLEGLVDDEPPPGGKQAAQR